MNKDNKILEREQCCPDRIPSPELPSPTDCLPPKELARVLEHIQDTNEFLLDLALSDDRPPHETYRKVFDGLIGVRVEIANEQGETVEGSINLVGTNFLLLREEGFSFLFPFDKIDKIEPYGKHAEPYPKLQLSEIDPCLRRDITFSFGKVVAASPELLHLFFGIRLETYLLLIGEKEIKVNTGGIIVEGIITETDKETITMDVNGERNIISIEKVSLITINA